MSVNVRKRRFSRELETAAEKREIPPFFHLFERLVAVVEHGLSTPQFGHRVPGVPVDGIVREAEKIAVARRTDAAVASFGLPQ